MSIRYLQLDVFPHSPGGGNPLGVVIGAEHWPPARMQAFAAWTDLVETTFLMPGSVPEADYRVRIFTPTREIAFAGHPTLGSAHAALATGLATARNGMLTQECQAGLLPIAIDGDGDGRVLSVRAPQARLLPIAEQQLLDAVLDGVPLGDIGCAFVEGGRRWWIAELLDEPTVRGWSPPHAAIAALASASDSLGLCVFARQASPFDVVVRAFPAGVGIVEDPASGAANGLIGALIAARAPSSPLARGYRVSQGREMGHDAELLIRIDGPESIWVGGRVETIIDGVLTWPG
jgi:PhzF family phenazine biosynthesis protein